MADDADALASLLQDMRERLIHIEEKADGIRAAVEQPPGLPAARYQGHPDQVFGAVTYAQFGEDLLVLNLFALLGIDAPGYLDVGAHHPVHVSNTALLYARGSRGINVEPNPHLIEAFRRERPEDVNLNVGVAPEAGSLEFYFVDNHSGRNSFSREAAEAFVRESPAFSIQKVELLPVMTLNDIVDIHADGKFPDFLSMDVEGLDVPILAAADFTRSAPAIICAEALTADDADNSSALRRVLATKGFAPIARTVANLLFAREDCLARLRP